MGVGSISVVSLYPMEVTWENIALGVVEMG